MMRFWPFVKFGIDLFFILFTIAINLLILLGFAVGLNFLMSVLPGIDGSVSFWPGIMVIVSLLMTSVFIRARFDKEINNSWVIFFGSLIPMCLVWCLTLTGDWIHIVNFLGLH